MELNRINNITTWNDASERLNENFDKIGLAIESIESAVAGEITSTDGSIGVTIDEGGVNLSVKIGNLIQDKKGLYASGNKIGIAIDPNEGNRLVMTATGMLRVESENYWEEIA